jgi:acyl-CoA synthetase (NDP forming)/GNAT superfamily N-acetyltransferase
MEPTPPAAADQPPARPFARPVDVLLADGRVAAIRPVQPDDLAALVRLHDEVSDEANRLRFFTVNRAVGHTYAERLCSGADPAVLGLVAELDGEQVAVASAEPESAQVKEVAFLVADHAHGLGLGTLLLEHLAAAARGRGVRRFSAEVLADNAVMLRVFHDAGFDVSSTTEHGVSTLELDTAATDRAVAAADRREFAAEARSLAPLLAPRSVAVVGVRRDGGGIGAAVLTAIREGGFDGELVVIHPLASSVGGVTAHRDLATVGHPVDLAVIAVPADRVVAAVRDAAAAGTRGLVILSSGLGELGGEGPEREREIVRIARRHSMRVVGPNCLGLLANLPGVHLNATFTRTLPPQGGVAVASQSGGVGIALLDTAVQTGLGMSWFVSLGNKADVSGNDLLAAWLDDDRVSAVGLYLESFGNATKFARVARRFAERKPLLAIVGGRSSSGRRAGASHTAAAAAPSVGVEALFAQSGVIACRSLTDLADTARLLTTQPMPAGPRLGIVGNAGGLGVLAADDATDRSLVVPELSPALSARLQARVSGTSGVSNPIDLGAAAGPEGFAGAVADLLQSDEVDAVLAVLAATAVTDSTGALKALAAHRAAVPDKPLLLVALGGVTVPPEITPALAATFTTVEDALSSLAHAAAYAGWRATPAEPPVPAPPETREAAVAVAEAALEALAPQAPAARSAWLTADLARDLLGCYGIEGPLGTVVQGARAAADAAERIGFPVVAKVADPDIVHKTDRGLVRVGLRRASDVRAAARQFADEVDDRSVAVLVQPQVEGGVEVALGIVRDPGFGPLVMVAAGGVNTDVWNDRVFLVPPLSDGDADRAIRSLRTWPLLAGFRGADPVDVVALRDVLVRLARLAVDVPHVAEVDLNPVLVTREGVAVVDVKMRLQAVDAERETVLDPGIPRRLREAR